MSGELAGCGGPKSGRTHAHSGGHPAGAETLHVGFGANGIPGDRNSLAPARQDALYSMLSLSDLGGFLGERQGKPS